MFSHDTAQALQTVVALVNTDPQHNSSEGLATVGDLADFVVEQRVSRPGPLTPDVLAAVKEVRSSFGPFFGLTDPAEAADLINDLLANATVSPRLTDHDGYAWHVHYFSPDAGLAEHLAVDGGMALAHVIVADEIHRLRLCEAPDCRAVLADLTRNRSKRYCDASTCGNRLHVAAYRERKRSEQAAAS